MKIIFMGTPDFALPAFEALRDSEHEMVAVYTAPPRPANRGKKVTKSVIHKAAQAANIEVHTPISLKSEEQQEIMRSYGADVGVVVAYGLLLPQAVLDAPRLGCVNIHPSDLPRWRGAAPIQRSIMAGDRQTAICIMQMDAGLDTGDVLMREDALIDDAVTAKMLETELAAQSAALLLKTLNALEAGTATRTPQAHEGVAYAAKIDKTEALINFDRPARDVLRHIHGLSPFPGAYLMHHDERIKLHQVEVIENTHAHTGCFVDEQFTIQCADGNAIRPIIMQRAGKQALPAEECLRALEVTIGEKAHS